MATKEKTPSEELVEVEELVWEMSQELDGPPQRVRVVGIGNGHMVSKAEAIEGIQAGNYRAAGHSRGKIPEGWQAKPGEPMTGGKKRNGVEAAEAKADDGGNIN